jgi:hypothetical protein
MLGLWLGGGIDEGSDLTRRSIFAGVVCGEIVMLTGKWLLG